MLVDLPVEGRSAVAVRATGLIRRFGSHVVLRGLDLELDWGEAVALVGSNGAGKTTLLRILAGSLTAQRGEARVAGAPAGSDSARRDAVLLAGDAYLYGDLTAAENLRFALQMAGRSPRTGCRPVAATLSRVGLGAFGDRRVRFFSSGMRKRLALARALVLDPPVLFLDEPYASLDDEASRLVDEVIEAWREPGRALLVATHRRGRARRTCDRVLRLEDGRIATTARKPRLLQPEGVVAGVAP